MQVAIRIVGPAGYGVKSIGKLLQHTLKNQGLYTFGYLGYPSLIRGGQNFYQVNVSSEPINASLAKTDILVALNTDAYFNYKHDLKNTGTILIDSDVTSVDEIFNSKLPKQSIIDIPVLTSLRTNNIPTIAQNTFMLGVILKILGLPVESADKVLVKKFAKKGKQVVESNKKAVRLGFNSINKNLFNFGNNNLNKTKKSKSSKSGDLMVLSGNDAIALGFIAGGGTFYSAYPMTPSTNILHFLAKHGDKYNMVVRQASTEIEAIGVASGASFAGARAMVGTSGGGLDLMGEFISMLGITEIPLVIVDAQRTGPGTGLPTWTEQSDLNMAKTIGHGEFPRIVLAPGDVKEAYELIQYALNWAEEWQIPVIFLSDKYLSESFFTVSKKELERIKVPVKRGKLLTKYKKSYLRYKFSQDGVSERALPGIENITQVVNSDEHDEYGNSIESDPLRTLMQAKRLQKMWNIKKQMPMPNVYGPRGAKNAIVAWGSMKWPAIEYAKKLNAKAKNTNDKYAVVHFWFMYPLNHKKLQKLFEKYNKVILIENNSTAQLLNDLKLANVEIEKTILKFDGEPLFIDEEIN